MYLELIDELSLSALSVELLVLLLKSILEHRIITAITKSTIYKVLFVSFPSTISSSLFLQNNIIIAYCIMVAIIFIIKFIVKVFARLDKIRAENLNDIYVNEIFITNKIIKKIKIFFKTLLRLFEFSS